MKNVFLSGAIATANTNIATAVGYANNAPNPGSGILGTQVGADWYNMITSEILTVVTSAGITPSATNWAQLNQAVSSFCIGNSASSYTNVFSTRALGNTYTNTFVRALAVAVTGSCGANAVLQALVNGSTLICSYAPSNTTIGINFLVPSGGQYKCNWVGGSGSLLSWQEL